MPRSWIIVALLLVGARIAAGWHERRHPPEVRDLVHWVDLAEASSRALEEGKPILLEFTAEWCRPCDDLDAEIFMRPEQAERVNEWFVPVRLVDRQQEDGANPPELERLQEQHDVRSFPTLVVTRADGSMVRTQIGYRGPFRTVEFLREARARARRGEPGHVP